MKKIIDSIKALTNSVEQLAQIIDTAKKPLKVKMIHHHDEENEEDPITIIYDDIASDEIIKLSMNMTNLDEMILYDAKGIEIWSE